MSQTEVRSALRDAVNTGSIQLDGISIADFRQLINGSTVNGVSLSTSDLRVIGDRGRYCCNNTEPAPVATEAPVATDIGQAFNALQQAVMASQRPSVDRNEVMQIAADVLDRNFSQQFTDAVQSNPDAFDAAVSAAVTKFATAEMQAGVSALVQSEFGQSTRSELASGDKTLLPPVRSVSSAFRENTTTRAIEQRILSRFHTIVSGPSGSGKTYPVEQVLNKLGRRYVKISCADGLSMSELLAEKTIEVENGSPVMRVILKALPICVREGLVLILDEADQLAGEILSMFNSAMDAYPATSTVPQTGEVIPAHPDFLIVLTCNGITDETGLYSGHQISGALKTRCRFVYADYLTKSEETDILEGDGLSASAASDVADAFIKLRQAHDTGILTMPPSTRTMLSISKALQGKDAYGQRVQALEQSHLDDAIRMTVLDALPKSERKAVAAAVGVAE